MTSLIQQRADGDCGIAALAMVAEVAYEDAYVAVSLVPGERTRRLRGKCGLTNQDLVRAAAPLGLALTPTRRYDLDVDEGVLRVRGAHFGRFGHFVAVKNGLVLCPTSKEVLPWQDYLERYKGRPCTLLRDA
jgi:hypothetical protein